MFKNMSKQFKKGAFYMAVETGFPIYPVVVHGAFECMKPGTFVGMPGKIYIRYLEPVSPKDWKIEDISTVMKSTRRNMSETLAEMRDVYPS